MTRLPFIAVLLVAATSLRAQPALHLPPLDRVLPARAEVIYTAVAPRIDTAVAMETVGFMGPSWRLAGNPAYDASLDFVASALERAGFVAIGGPDPQEPSYWIDSFPNAGQGWEHTRGTLAIEGANGRDVVLSRERDRVALAINSWPTPAGGATYPLVDVGVGTSERDYASKMVSGAVVLASGPISQAWSRAVRERRAAGVVSTDLAPYTRPAETPEVLQWGSIPYQEAQPSFAFKASPRAAEQLRRALARGPTRVHVDIAARFHRRPNRTLVAEIPGASRRDERVVLVAHVQEPGANDNASGAGALLAVAGAVRQALATGAMARPARTLTFLWLDEIRGSEHWIAQNAGRARNVVAMMSLDMAGQDTTKTGGTFLIEKSPDPSALWDRPSDPHSEWGRSDVDRALVRGHVLNDLHLAACLRRARDTGWIVRTNPYEGGSDHTVFTKAGVPALLNWHFTDRYYHTNLDTPDKTSPETMGHVAAAVATTATFLASAGPADADDLVRLVDEAERARLQTEQKNAATDEILAAWRQWYAEAKESVARVAR